MEREARLAHLLGRAPPSPRPREYPDRGDPDKAWPCPAFSPEMRFSSPCESPWGLSSASSLITNAMIRWLRYNVKKRPFVNGGLSHWFTRRQRRMSGGQGLEPGP